MQKLTTIDILSHPVDVYITKDADDLMEVTGEENLGVA